MSTPFDEMTDKQIADEIRNVATELKAHKDLSAIINTCAKMMIVCAMDINSTTTTITFKDMIAKGVNIGD